METDVVVKPAEAAARLGMPPSTLRVYSTKFASLLSEKAGTRDGDEDRRGGHRLYSEDDLAILSKAKALLGRGLTYDQVLRELKGAVVPTRPVGASGGSSNGAHAAVAVALRQVDAALPGLMAAIQSSQRAADAWHMLATERQRENEELRERIAFLERRLSAIEESWGRLVAIVTEEEPRRPGLLDRLLGR